MPELQHGMVVDGHLGGYVPGGDPNTWYPTLWLELVGLCGGATRPVRVLDVGCGDGKGSLAFFRELGCNVYGMDGIEQDDPDVMQHDFTLGPMPTDRRAPARVDLVWSAEFVEHVEERFVPNVLSAFRLGELVLMTHAQPGQAGWHHVNCRRDDYWIGAMAGIGYKLDEELTQHTRSLAMRDAPDPKACYYGLTGLAFRRTP